MSCHPSPRMSSGGETPWGARSNACARAPWRPLEIAAAVAGFMVFWPIGLGVVLLKVWQRKFGYEGDMFAFGRDQYARFQHGWSFGSTGASQVWRAAKMSGAGNSAFDEWREKELARLEEERRKIVDAERDFARHIEELRRAKDREEFESFMRSRGGGSGA
jgi:hypothetical protein